MTQRDAFAADDAAEAMKSRLRTDLRSAMVAKDPSRVRVLRALITALDDAQAVPVGDQHLRYAVHAFGDRSAEVPRLRLTEEDVQRVLAHEAAARTAAAAEMRRLGDDERAQNLDREAALTVGYL
jgi:hypothetical protein